MPDGFGRSPKRKWYGISYEGGGPMAAISASEARRSLFPLLEQVNADRTHVEITSRHGGAVLMSLVEFEALQETAYLLRAPTNARRLIESLAHARSGKATERDLVEP
jgi:antitoxin YefM